RPGWPQNSARHRSDRRPKSQSRQERSSSKAALLRWRPDEKRRTTLVVPVERLDAWKPDNRIIDVKKELAGHLWYHVLGNLRDRGIRIGLQKVEFVSDRPIARDRLEPRLSVVPLQRQEQRIPQCRADT